MSGDQSSSPGLETGTLDVGEVSVDLGGATILEEVSLTARSGELVGVIGPNGAGKTTLLRVIRGAIAPRAGDVRFDGASLLGLSAKATSRRVATLPQDASVPFSFTVEEAVAMGRNPHIPRFSGPTREDRRAVHDAMERTSVAEFADRPITELSGGERQRVLVARAIAQATPCLLLDEPTASLDINHAIRTLELARSLVAEGKTALAAIHDLNLAARYCDRLVLLSAGRVLATGSPEVVLTSERIRSAFGARAVVVSDPTVEAPLVTPLADVPTRSGDVHVIGGGSTARRVVTRLAVAGYDVSVGAVPDGDVAAAAAARYGGDAITTPPFGRIGEATATAVADRCAAADAVVVVGAPVPANAAAAERGSTVVRVRDDAAPSPTDVAPDAADDAVAVESLLDAVGSALDREGPPETSRSDAASGQSASPR
ncbi:heme ABC transporter ATP-binding protein [Haloferacaceae archaeon DSL9]